MNESNEVRDVWYVDNDTDDLESFSEVMIGIDQSIDFRPVHNGIDFMAYLFKAKKNPDLIFIDLNMRRKTGLQLIREIRSHSIFTNIKLIVFTTSNQFEHIESTYQAGANLYIEKPWKFSEWKKIIAKAIELNWGKYVPQPPFEYFVWKKNDDLNLK